jgi:hypothetical protein
MNRFDRVTPQPDGSFQHSYRGQPVPGPTSSTGVPDVVARTLLRQAELFEQLFDLHDVLDVAYVADTLRVAAGLAPIHDGPTSEKSAALEQRRTLADQLLREVERVANGGKVARVQLLDGVPLAVAEARVDPGKLTRYDGSASGIGETNEIVEQADGCYVLFRDVQALLAGNGA